MRTVILLFFTCTIATAQTSVLLREKYGNPSSETYRVRPDINVTVTYAKTGEVCEMLIKPASETVNGKPLLFKSQPLNDVIDELVPKAERGTFIIGTFVNPCMSAERRLWRRRRELSTAIDLSQRQHRRGEVRNHPLET